MGHAHKQNFGFGVRQQKRFRTAGLEGGIGAETLEAVRLLLRREAYRLTSRET